MADTRQSKLTAYRGYIAKLAGGGRLDVSEQSDIEVLADALDLPEWAVRRDVAAAVAWQTADARRRMELVLNHPHLFDEPKPPRRRHTRLADTTLPVGKKVAASERARAAARPGMSATELAAAADCGVGVARRVLSELAAAARVAGP